MVSITAWDINSNQLITHLTVNSYSFNVRINDAGEFQMAMNLTDANVSQQAAVLLSLKGNPYKVIFAADAFTILYSGIAWKTKRVSNSYMLTIAGKALTSYFQQVVLTKNYDAAVYPSGVSPAVLLATVVTDVQNQPGAQLGIVPTLQTRTVPVPVTPAYTKDQEVTAAQVVADMTAATVAGTGGTDYYMSDLFTNGVPVHRMMIATPRCGRDQSVSALTLNLATALEWEWETDAQASGNQIIVVGSGTGSTQNRTVVNSALGRGGPRQMPLMQVVLQYSQVDSPTQLAGIANGSLTMYQRPVCAPSVTLAIDDPSLPLGKYTIGDDVQVFAPPSPWWPNGMTEWWRIVAYAVTYPDAGVPKQKLTLNRPPQF